MNANLQHKLDMLPESPGCYIMKQNDEIIYIGKAKNLKNRVKQYFHGKHTPKVAAMVERVDDFELMLCESNFEALTLECNLIKKHQPFYNILLKDDKQYPYLKLNMNEAFPRLVLARRMEHEDKATYFGPYIGATMVRHVMNEVGRFFRLRTCTLSFPLKQLRRPCMHHQVGRCMAPCADLVSENDYLEQVKQVVAFLNGDAKQVINQMTEEMNRASELWQFEQAAVIRDKIANVKQLMQNQLAIQTKSVHQDVIAIIQDDVDAMVQMMHISEGRIEDGDHFLMPNCGSEDKSTILTHFITQYYDDAKRIPSQILLGNEPEDEELLIQWLREKNGKAVSVTIPQRGDKAGLVRLAEKNAQNHLYAHREKVTVKTARTLTAMQELKDALNLPTMPRRIEGYDISNTQGILSVGSMVVFVNGLPAKKSYRTFRIKTVEGPNDFASMAEVITRRFTHGIKERKERREQGLPEDGGSFSTFPDVILIDGGTEQLAFAQRAMHECGLNLPMFSLAKRLEEVFLPDSTESIMLPRKSNALHLIQYVRDETHRFGITHHRSLRGKASIASALDEIEGIGPKRKQALLKHFGSLKAIWQADFNTLCEVDGITPNIADRILEYANSQKK